MSMQDLALFLGVAATGVMVVSLLVSATLFTVQQRTVAIVQRLGKFLREAGPGRAELVDHEHYPSHAAASASIGDYIDNFYNVDRRHSHLGYVNPIEFELRSAARAAA